jgi:porin
MGMCSFAQDGLVPEIPWVQAWISQPGVTGDWNGERDKLEDQGITFSLHYTTDIGGNPTGGLKQTSAYSGFLNLTLALDFEKLASLEGWALTITNYLASGSNLSEAIGNHFGVQEIYAPGSYYFGQFDLSKTLFDDTVSLEVGRLFAGDVFAATPLWNYYVSGALNDHIADISSNIFFPVFNITTWGTRISYEPTDEWHLIAGIYNADPSVADIDNYGAYFNFRTQYGYLAVGQLTYSHDQDSKGEGLPGSTSFGAYYESSKFPGVAEPNREWRGNYGLYLMFDQMIFRGEWPEYEGPSHLRSGSSYSERVKHPYYGQTALVMDRPKGLIVWGMAYLAPQERINTQTYQLAGGLMYKGLPPNRDHDVTALCVIVGKFSDKLPAQGYETVLEFNHRFQLAQWFYITPDIQYVITPNGQNNIRDALVLGLEVSVSF